ncbi:hypothetical protein ACFYTQ_28265 [Nocardia sp. NPDC004068]|uniref:hypothetical protein n=1 Tax=Nocardia sp. NPDC004068 TaxID=3364303 RepID=UPI0036BC642E
MIVDPSPLRRRLVLVDIGAGFSVGSAAAVTLAARTVESLVLVTQAGINQGEHSTWTRLLERLDRADVSFISDYRTGDGELHPPVEELIDYIATAANSAAHAIVWMGFGAMTNLGRVLDARPDLAGEMHVTQLGGRLDSADGGNDVSRNLRLDPRSAQLVLQWAGLPRFVLDEHAEAFANLITATSPLYRQLATSKTPWVEEPQVADGPWMREALTVSAALQQPYVHFRTEKVVIDADGQLRIDPTGNEVEVTSRIDYEGLLLWLAAALR